MALDNVAASTCVEKERPVDRAGETAAAGGGGGGVKEGEGERDEGRAGEGTGSEGMAVDGGGRE